ncbi:MAG: galactarate dehydratase [Candidatus Solibacter sp.]|nr:galactarate dehydratase [Candidatus Solibacter sp.]
MDNGQVMSAPTALRVHRRDNVGIVVRPEGVKPGEPLDGGAVVLEAAAQGQKIATAGIEAGEPVIRYGQVIGRALRRVEPGGWLREQDISLPEPPDLDRLELATRVPPDPPPLDDFTFDGYANGDGSTGTRNLLGITTTVQCVAPTVEFAVQRIRKEILPRYRNVDGVVAITHNFGCGVAIDAPGAEVPIRTIAHLSRHANIGGRALIVSLGCEKMQPARLDSPPGSGLAVLDPAPDVIRLQDRLGFGAMISSICEAAEKRLEELDRRRRTACPASELIVGLQCGGSDAFSGVTANPAVGFAADLLVRAGATVMFSEVTEVRDAAHLLTPRCATVDVAQRFIEEMRWYDAYLARLGADRSANTTPGNKRGGLANIVEKALGSVAKSGTTAIRAVAGQGEKVTAKGLVFAATPASDFVCGTQQLASMNMHVFTTGEGTPYGLAMAPVVKVSSRTALAEKWPDLIDLDAGRIATGEATIESTGWDLFRLILDIAGGKRSWAEHWGLANALAPFHPGAIT